MQSKLASIIKEQFKGLDFINKLGGLTFVQTQKQAMNNLSNEDKTDTLIKKFPCSTDVWLRESNVDLTNKIIDFIPNSGNVGMVYFEPTSDIREIAQRGIRSQYSCGYRVVFFGNGNKISTKDGTSSTLQIQMQKAIKSMRGISKDGFICINPRITGIQTDANIFSKYTYSEEVTQYLMPPFIYFAINIDVTFFSSNGCCTHINPKISEC